MIHTHLQNTGKVFILAAALALPASCHKSESSTNGTSKSPDAPVVEAAMHISKAQMETAGIMLDGFSHHTFHNKVSATGMFDVPPSKRASVNTYYAGYVRDIDILPGQKVDSGQVLFTLENPEYVNKQQDFLEARAQLAYLKADYERQKALVEDQVSSQKKYTLAETDYKTMLARYEALRKQLELMHINPDKLDASNISSQINVMAPITGYLVDVNVNKGMYLNPSDMAATIVNPGHLHVELSIFEKDLKEVKPGQTIEFNLLNAPGDMYEGVVYLVGKSVDPEKRTIRVHGHLKDEKLTRLFTPGMYLEASILTSSEDQLSLPNDALVEVDGTYFVLQEKKDQPGNGLYVKREVKTGKRDNFFTQILNTEDFPGDARFIVKGAFNLITD